VHPQPRGDRRGDEEEYYEDVLELRQESAPRGRGLLGGELVAPVACEPRLRFGVAEPSPLVCIQRGYHLADGSPIGIGHLSQVGDLSR
jgi:hypothetical protein